MLSLAAGCHVGAFLLLQAPAMLGQESSAIQLTGTAINTTDPEKPVAAPIQFEVRDGACQLTVSPPLIGTGLCRVRSFDEKSGKIDIVSVGTPAIAWSGTIKGNFAAGTYKMLEGNQAGTFYLAVLPAATRVSSAPNVSASPTRRSSCSPAIESAITGDVEGWNGETIFKLDNGQIWQQSGYAYTYFYSFHPDVTIYETSSGCRMKVEDESETVLVKRIK